MNSELIQTLLGHELRMLIRDRRAVFLAVVLPLVTTPIILVSMNFMSERRDRILQGTVYQYAVVGSDRDQVRKMIQKEKAAMSRQAVGVDDAPEGLASFQFEELDLTKPDKSLESEAIHFYLSTYNGREADLLRNTPSQETESEPGAGSQRRRRLQTARLPGVPLVRIHYQGDRDSSQSGRTLMSRLLRQARTRARDDLLHNRGFVIEPASLFTVEEESLATPAQVGGATAGKLLTFFLLMLMLSGGSVVALDSVAGEKERGSLETILTTGVKRTEIVAAKQIVIAGVAVLITIIQVANILIYVHFRAIELPDDFAMDVGPTTLAVLLILFIPLAALIGAVLLLLSAYAKSYKEAQLYFFPTFLISLVPALAAALPGIRLRSAIALVPIANVSVAVRDLLVGQFDWVMLGVTCMVTSGAAIWTVRATARILSTEQLITSSQGDISPLSSKTSLFQRHVLKWYAVMGAVLFAIAANFPQLATFRRQLILNEVGIFLLVPFFMIWKYRLPIREALALRTVRPAVWLGVLLIIPSGHLVGIAVFRLANSVFPVPETMLEEFGRQIVPENVPIWQMILFISILPGICEEIAFRGTLLFGLHRRLRPIALALTVGVIFGLFHVSLFRIIPTAFLGVILTAVALLTGSILPCIVIHAGNNAVALWADHAELPMASLAPWHYVVAGITFCGSLVVFYRSGERYPGLRTFRVR